MTNDASGATGPIQSDVSNAQTHPVDTTFDALANQRRRYVLRCLQQYSNPMALADVADEIAVWETDTEITEISGEEVKRVYTSLYHAHVPKLADAGIIEYYQDRDTITLSVNGDQLETLLDSVTE